TNLKKFQGFKNTTAMTGQDNHLYIASNGWLYKVDKNGKILISQGGFENVTSMGAIRSNPLLLPF
uniref:hypothetical protein n=1 Tax=Larkinella soli TaxID=1770527 RepID=UPI0019D11DA6